MSPENPANPDARPLRVERIEKLPPSDAPIYNDPKFLEITNIQINLLNQRNREEEGDTAAQFGNWKELRQAVETRGNDISASTERMRHDLERVVYESERLFRHLTSTSDPDKLAAVKRDFIDATRSYGQTPNQADLEALTEQLDTIINNGLDIARMQEAVKEQSLRTTDRIEDDPEFQFRRYFQDKEGTAMGYLKRNLEMMIRDYQTDPTDFNRGELEKVFLQYEGVIRSNTITDMFRNPEFNGKIREYMSRWQNLFKKESREYATISKTIPEEKRSELLQLAADHPYDPKLLSQIEPLLPAEQRARLRSSFRLGQLLGGQIPLAEEREPARTPTLGREGMERASLLERGEVIREHGSDEEVAAYARALGINVSQLEEKVKKGEQINLRAAVVAVEAENWRKMVDQQLGSAQAIPQREGETNEEYIRRAKGILQTLGYDERQINIMTTVRGKPLEGVRLEIAKLVEKVARKNDEWSQFNFNSIQELLTGVKYFDLLEEREIKASFQRGEIDAATRNQQLEQELNKKERLITNILGQIALHNVRRFALAGTLEQMNEAIKNIPQDQLREMMEMPGVSTMVRRITAFQGAWVRKEDRFTEFTDDPELRSFVNRADTAVGKGTKWELGTVLDVMMKELIYRGQDIMPEKAMTRMDVLNAFGKEQFMKFMANVYRRYANNLADFKGEGKDIQFYDTFVLEALAESDLPVSIRGYLEDKDRKDYLVNNLTSMMFESVQAIDVAHKSAYVTFEVFRLDGAKWKKDAYQRELARHNEKRQAVGLPAVDYMPNLASPDEVIINTPDPRDKSRQIVINLAAIKHAQAYIEAEEEVIRQLKERNNYDLREYDRRKRLHDQRVKSGELKVEYEESKPEKLNFEQLSDEVKAYVAARARVLIVGDEEPEYWRDGQFDRAKFDRDKGLPALIKQEGAAWDLPQIWTEARRDFNDKYKDDLNINEPTKKEDAADFDPRFDIRSLSGKSDTLGRRLLNLMSYYLRDQNKNKINIFEMASLLEIGGVTQLEVTGKLSIREQLLTRDQDIAAWVGTWIARNMAVEQARSSFTDSGSIIAFSKNSIRNKPYEGLAETGKAVSKAMPWKEFNKWFKDGLWKIAYYDTYEIERESNGDYRPMNILQADSLFLQGYLDANIEWSDYRELQSRLLEPSLHFDFLGYDINLAHWSVFETAVLLNKTKKYSPLLMLLLDALKQGAKAAGVA